MVRYYLDEPKEKIDPKWVDAEALETAKKLVVKREGRPDDRNSIKSSQLRKFYADVKNTERAWQAQDCSEAAFAGILPLIKILKAKAAYAKSRDVVPAAFHAWICEHVDSIAQPRDFKAFLLHFEAVVGFCYGEGLKD